MKNDFLLIDATDRSKFSSNQHQILFDVRLYLLSLFAITPLNESHIVASAEVSFL